MPVKHGQRTTASHLETLNRLHAAAPQKLFQSLLLSTHASKFLYLSLPHIAL